MLNPDRKNKHTAKDDLIVCVLQLCLGGVSVQDFLSYYNTTSHGVLD